MLNKTIPLFSAQKANNNINLTIPIMRVLDSNWFVLGNEVRRFEQEFAEYINVKHCISVGNGTDAIELALRALDIGKNDKVITVANAGFYSSTAIHAVGAHPIYVDVDSKSLTMSRSSLKDALKKSNPKAVIITHLYGQLAEIEDLLEITRSADLPLIEDCAQAHGAIRNGKMAGSYGDVSCFSFYPTKNLGALGDGGAILTNKTELANKISSLRQYGWLNKYHVALPNGRNSRLDEIQAAILREKLPYLDTWNSARRKIAKLYNHAFKDLPVQCPHSTDNDYVAHLYVLRLNNREEFRDFLKQHGVVSDVHYPIPDHLQVGYANDHCFENLSVTEATCKSVVSLPCFPGLSSEEIEIVIAVVTDYFYKQ